MKADAEDRVDVCHALMSAFHSIQTSSMTQLLRNTESHVLSPMKATLFHTGIHSGSYS